MSKLDASNARPFSPHSKQERQFLNRKWFIRQLIPHIGGLRYAWLSFHQQSIESVETDAQLHIAVDTAELQEWEEICRNSPYISNLVVDSGKISTIIYLEFKDQGLLELNLIHCVGKKGDIFSNSKKLLAKSTINDEGIKVAPYRYILEYLLISAYCEHQNNRNHFLQEYAILPFTQKLKTLRRFSKSYQHIINDLKGNTAFPSSSWDWLKQTSVPKWAGLSW